MVLNQNNGFAFNGHRCCLNQPPTAPNVIPSTVYGSTQPLGDIDTQTLGAISKVNTDASKVPIQSRAMATKAPLEGADNPVPRVVEFAESTILIQTEP